MTPEEIKKLEAENEHLKRINSLRSDLVSMSAHQLRTSLSTLKWVLKMFLDGDFGGLTAEQKKYMKKLYRSNEQMIGIIGEMLAINQAEDVALESKIESTRIEKLIKEVLSEFTAESAKREIDITFSKPKEKLPHVHVDKEKIRVVIQNLIDNAVKYSDAGDKVNISAEQSDEMIKISVKDTGIGIPEKDQSHIFEKLVRSENAKKKEVAGTGLGLFISKNFVERHGGKIWFESKENKGSTFHFTIPVSRP